MKWKRTIVMFSVEDDVKSRCKYIFVHVQKINLLIYFCVCKKVYMIVHVTGVKGACMGMMI